MKNQLPLIIAIVALATAVFGVVRSKQSSQATQPGQFTTSTPSVPAEQPGLEPAPAPAPVAVSPASASGTDEAQLALLQDIQNRLLLMETRLGNMKGGWEGLARRGLVPLTDEDKLKFQQQAMDASLSLEERLSAMNLLRRHGAVTDGVVQSLAQLAASSTDPEIKEEIYEVMDGVTNAALKGVLMAAINNEQEADVRRRIADAMSSFSGDSDVQAWLRHLTQSDPDERVKREAMQALTRRLDRMETGDLQQVVMDNSVTTVEKLSALGRLRRQGDGARSPEVVATMLDLYNGTEDTRTRVEIIRNLDGVTDEILMQPLLVGLAEDQNARLREEAADALSAYKANPDVAAWLKYAAENDPDPRVQRQAQASLDGSDDQRDSRREEWRRRFERGDWEGFGGRGGRRGR